MTENDRNIIRRIAYFKWLDAGAPWGDGREFWLNAESDYFGSGARDADSVGQRSSETQLSKPSQAAAGSTLPPDEELVLGSRA